MGGAVSSWLIISQRERLRLRIADISSHCRRQQVQEAMERSIAVQGAPFEVVLSHWDRTFPPTHSKRMLCFECSRSIDKEYIIQCLHLALHNLVQAVPFLAGSVVPFTADEGDRPWLRNLSSEGSAWLDIRDLSAEYSIDTFRQSNYDQKLFDADKFCSLPRVIYIQQEPVDVCRFCVTFIEGGAILAVQILHTVVDGYGVTECLKIFAESFRTAQVTNDFELRTTNTKYCSDRTVLLNGNGHVGNIQNHPAFTTSPFAHGKVTGIDDSCRSFRISATALEALKKAASPLSHGENGQWISTGDAVAAFIWTCLLKARQRQGLLEGKSSAFFGQSIDCRRLLELPEPYFGNAFYIMRSDVPVSTLLDDNDNLRTAAAVIRADVKSITADRIRDLVALMEKVRLESHTRMSFMEDLASTAIIYSSHFKFDIHSLDFGPAFGDGHIKAFRHPTRGNILGSVIVMPRCQDGSCEFTIAERAEVFDTLAKDELWTRYTSESDTQAARADR
jgi:hypothetical protein